MTSVRWKRNTEDELPKIIGDLVNISTNKILEKKDDFVKKLEELSVEVNNKETELSEKVEGLKKELYKYDEQNRVLPLGIEMEEIDSLVCAYMEETKHNSKEKEVKQKEARAIESELRKKIGDVDLEATIFQKCEEIAELKLESEQLQENTSRLEAKIETRTNT
ncbi:4252_t:CDS:2 [Paraglomus occultum]|uniref:4252_t:CDS:1 n=1 Tax=Paraglomus occultum TaxID=144539 RepID=A0A9N9CHC5_9GLOM|nr:4252_t:CDS:2 [Paraglomus occultum]